jgi:hypothetical protein
MAKTRSQSQEAPPKLTIGSLTKSQRKKLQNISSKYEIWYTLGVLNLLVTAVVAVRFPAYFWIYYFLKILYYVPYRYYRFERKIGNCIYSIGAMLSITFPTFVSC